MQAKDILQSDLLDIVFDDRNKDYGAYQLRKTYNKRITKALLITASVALLALLGSFIANKVNAAKEKVKKDRGNTYRDRTRGREKSRTTSATSASRTAESGNEAVYSSRN